MDKDLLNEQHQWMLGQSMTVDHVLKRNSTNELTDQDLDDVIRHCDGIIAMAHLAKINLNSRG